MNEQQLAMNRRRFVECLSVMGLGHTLLPDALMIAAQDSATVTVAMIQPPRAPSAGSAPAVCASAR